MALPVLEGIASVFGAAVPAYQQARNFVLESQQAALDYRIEVANLITRLRTAELANAARMRAAAADAVSNVRRSFAIGSPEYQAVVAQLRTSNVPQEQQDAFLGSLRTQGYLTEDQRDLVFDLTKGDRPEDAGAGAGAGEEFGLLEPSFFEYESSLINSQINSNLKEIEDLKAIRADDSEWANMAEAERTSTNARIEFLENQSSNLINDQRAALNSRNYLQQNPTASLAKIRELFPQSWLARQEAGNAGMGTPVVTPPIPVDQPRQTVWGGGPPPQMYGPFQNQGMSPQDSSRVRGSVELVRPQF